MDSIHSEFLKLGDYSDKAEGRFKALSNNINKFIDKLGFSERVKLDELALGYALVDYFEDIQRLKSFHNVEHVNGIKIVAYTSYWLLKRKPIQIMDCGKELLYLNERFVLQYILTFLSSKDKGFILLQSKSGLTSFSETLFYYLKYRITTANNLEMIILAFFAGQIYQSDDDISSSLGKVD